MEQLQVDVSAAAQSTVKPVPLVTVFGCFFVTLLFIVAIALVSWRWLEEPGIRAG